MQLAFEEVRRHVYGGGRFNDIVTEEIRQEIRERMPAYLWIDTWDAGKMRTYICDGCMSEWTERRTRSGWTINCDQNRETYCPQCHGRVTVKSINRGHAFKDKLNAVWYKKSEIEPGAVVAIAAHCQRDYDTGRPWTVETEIYWRGAAIFRYGEGSTRWQEKTHWEYAGQFIGTPEWREIRKVDNMVFGTESTGLFGSGAVPRCVLIDTIKESICGTPFDRAWHDEYLLTENGQDGVKALDAIAKYPCIEYMTKLGFTEFLHDKLAGDLPAGLINWRGKSMEKVLKLSRQRLGEVKASGMQLHPRLLLVLQYCERQGIRITLPDAAAMAWMLERIPAKEGAQQMEEALSHHQPNRRAKAIKYMSRLVGREATAGVHRTALRDFRDYWRQCAQLGDRMEDDSAVFPRDFHEAHERYSMRIRAIGNAEKDKQITARYDELDNRFGFEFGGLILRPARDCEEVIREGQVLHHCVGGYVDRYAEGRTIICVLRRSVEPDTPWRTVEIAPTGYLVQDRGYRNDQPSGIIKSERYQLMLNLFWEAWRERGKVRKSA